MNETAGTWGESASERKKKNDDKQFTSSELAELACVKCMSLERNSNGYDKYDHDDGKWMGKNVNKFLPKYNVCVHNSCHIIFVCEWGRADAHTSAYEQWVKQLICLRSVFRCILKSICQLKFRKIVTSSSVPRMSRRLSRAPTTSYPTLLYWEPIESWGYVTVAVII